MIRKQFMKGVMIVVIKTKRLPIACYIPETNNWYLEFPEEIAITY